VGAQRTRTCCGAVLAGLAATLCACAVWADSPSAVYQPDAFRESITEDNLKAQGYDPSQYELEIPISANLSISRDYVRAEADGVLPGGVAERGTDKIRFDFSRRGALSLTQDEARATGLWGTFGTLSRKRTAVLAQGLGGGTTSGTLTLSHEDSFASDTVAGSNTSAVNSAALSMGLTGSYALNAGASFAEGVAQTVTESGKIDVALLRDGAALAEYHSSAASTNGVGSETTTLALRTPTLELGSIGNMSASHTRTETGASEAWVNAVSLSVKPLENVSLTASHTDSEVASGPGTQATNLTSQITLRDDTTLVARYSGSEVEGGAATSQRAVTVTHLPTGGHGLGASASYTSLRATGAMMDPTVDVQLSYTTPSAIELRTAYHDENNRSRPELAAGVKLPLMGASIDLGYHEATYNATTGATNEQRFYTAEVARPLLWGMSGSFGYSLTDHMTDPAETTAIRLGVAGQNPTVGTIGLQYETGQLRTPTGTIPTGKTIGVTFAREFGVAGVGVTARRTLPAGSDAWDNPNDQIQVDITANW